MPTITHLSSFFGRFSGLVRHALGLFCVLAIAAPSTTWAQCAPRWLPGEGTAGVTGTVYGLASLSQGDVIAVGAFTVAGSEEAPNIARWSAATGNWSAVGQGLNAPALAIVALPSGELIVGGQFTASGSSPLASIARLNPAAGTWTPLGLGVAGGEVWDLQLSPGGDVYVAGSFGAAGGIPVKGLARWSPQTGQWSSLGAPSNHGVHVSASDLSGNLYVGATFGPGVFNATGIARRAAASQAWETLGPGVGGDVSAIAVLPSGLVAVGGNFNIAGGQPASGIALWNPVSRTWSALGSGVDGQSPTVSEIIPLSNDDLLVTGRFSTAGGVSAPNIAVWHASTSAWSAVGPIGSGLNGQGVSIVRISAGPSAGQVIVGGSFGSAGQASSAVAASNVVRLDPGSGAWGALGSGMNGTVHAITTDPSGKQLVVGAFSRSGVVGAGNIALWDPASNTWASLGGGVNGTASAAAFSPAGDAVVGGQFTIAYSASGTPILASRIARWNAAAQTWTSLGSGIGGAIGSRVLSVAVLPGGDIIAGGGFISAGGAPAVSIARWSAVSSSWSPMGTGMDGLVYALAALPSGDIIAGGDFTSAGGVAANGIARWNASTQTWSSLGAGVDGTVFAMAMGPSTTNDDQLFIAGNFAHAGGVPANSITAWNPSSGTWSPLGAFGGGVDPVVFALTPAGPSHPGDVIVGGSFQLAGGAPARSIARWRASTRSWTALGPGVNSTVNALAVLPRGDILAGGSFTMAGETVSTSFARWTTHPACTADFNCSGAADINDLFAYIAVFLAGDAAGDIDGSDGLTTTDLFGFLAAWFGGC
jgi:hypothetical protein